MSTKQRQYANSIAMAKNQKSTLRLAEKMFGVGKAMGKLSQEIERTPDAMENSGIERIVFLCGKAYSAAYFAYDAARSDYDPRGVWNALDAMYKLLAKIPSRRDIERAGDVLVRLNVVEPAIFRSLKLTARMRDQAAKLVIERSALKRGY